MAGGGGVQKYDDDIKTADGQGLIHAIQPQDRDIHD